MKKVDTNKPATGKQGLGKMRKQRRALKAEIASSTKGAGRKAAKKQLGKLTKGIQQKKASLGKTVPGGKATNPMVQKAKARAMSKDSGEDAPRKKGKY